jgi:hypothetical protein
VLSADDFLFLAVPILEVLHDESSLNDFLLLMKLALLNMWLVLDLILAVITPSRLKDITGLEFPILNY